MRKLMAYDQSNIFLWPFLAYSRRQSIARGANDNWYKSSYKIVATSGIVDVVLPVHLRMTLVTTLYVAYKTQFFSDWFDSEAQGSLYPQTFRSGNMLPQLDGVKSPDPLVT